MFWKRSTTQEEAYTHLSVYQLMWKRFARNRVALGSATILISFYVIIAFAGFFSPYHYLQRHVRYVTMPPQGIHFFDEEGKFHLRPFTFRRKRSRDPETLAFVYKGDLKTKDPLYLFIEGEEYPFFWTTSNIHLFGTKEGSCFIFGTDLLGRDVLARILYGARITLSVGLIAVFIVMFLGAVIGAVSGYLGGWIDHLIQRVIEIFRLFPSISLWLALAAVMPPNWPPIYAYMGIILIYGLIQWPSLAREVRGMILVLKESEFVLASEAAGAGLPRIMFKHLIPNIATHLMVSATLGIPMVVIFESTLSFFGLGVRAPMTSWGALLKDANNYQVLSFYPWLLIPSLFIIASVLLFNFLGDGLRDAIDPYS